MDIVTGPTDRPDSRLDRPGEATTVHTCLLRLALGIEDSRSYWEHVDPHVSIRERAELAFEQRWFGSKSLERVRRLLSNFAPTRGDGAGVDRASPLNVPR